jgi:HK97 family phage portal protein
MSFWAWIRGDSTGITANSNNPASTPPNTVGPDTWTPGDPDGFEITDDGVEGRTVPVLYPGPWSGWPATWATPNWWPQVNCLADTAWACLDKNSSILASLPVYKTRGGEVVDPEGWMTNPDPRVYTSWYEFAKQLFWDYQACGEAFVYATDYFSSGWPMFMRIIPPPMVNVEMDGSIRRYSVGSVDITADVLHIRYKSQVGDARGVGPLDIAGARLTASCVLARYVSTMTTAPPPFMTLTTDQQLNAETAQTIADQWMTARAANAGLPVVLESGLKLETLQVNAKDMALLELAQFTDARICVLLGVPPFLMALPSGDSMTYSNVEQVFEYHDRSQLRTEAVAVMTALSGWALPRGQNVELDREEYSRPPLTERVNAYKTLVELGAMDASEIRPIERTFFAAAPAIDSPMVAVNGAPDE